MEKNLYNRKEYLSKLKKWGDNMAKKGVPKQDGSGKGVRTNKGRGGCVPPKNKNVQKNKQNKL